MYHEMQGKLYKWLRLSPIRWKSSQICCHFHLYIQLLCILILPFIESYRNKLNAPYFTEQGWQVSTMHGNYRGNYPVITDTVKILSTMVEMVEMVEILKVITDMVKILSTMVEMVEILKCPIEENLSTNLLICMYR